LNTGYLENALAKIKGNTKKIVLLSSYLCHPSMANNKLSGPLVLLGLYEKIKKWKKRNFNYYFLINPETIGSICFLSTYKELLQKNLHSGLVLTCLGGSKNKVSYKKTRSENNTLDRLFKKKKKKKKCLIRNFNPSDGSDERQYCSSELNLPVGQIARSVYGEYYQYHTSGDNKKFMKIKKVFDSINFLEKILKINDSIFPLIRKEPYCELQLGKRNLYPNINFESADKKKSSDNLIDNREQRNILMGILSYADGKHDVLDVAEKLNIDIEKFPKILDIALKNKLILL
jgi:aminopeptidase-like protein